MALSLVAFRLQTGRRALLVSLAGLALALPEGAALAQSPADGGGSVQQAAPPPLADEIADFFSKVGDQVYEECIFQLSPEQIEVQTALTQAYIDAGATSAIARKLAVKQIVPPPLSARCEQLRHVPPLQAPVQEEAWAPDIAPEELAPSPEEVPPPSDARPETTQPAKKKPAAKPAPVEKAQPTTPPPIVALASRKPLPQWDCASDVDYVTVTIKGFPRKLTGGEICNPYQDVVYEVPAWLPTFRLGYTIRTGRLFIETDNPAAAGKTIAWAISGRDMCRNDPDPDCLAAKAVGPLPPGEYSFASNPNHRVSFGPKTQRHVAGIYLKKLWNKDQFTPAQLAGIRARGNIAIHVRLKGEMSEACIGLEPKGWAHVAQLIKEGRATGVNVYIDEPHPQVAEAPPVVVASSFSLMSLFK